MKTLEDQIEESRSIWAKVAADNEWYPEDSTPFYVQVWVKDGEVIDSVSFEGLDRDIIIRDENEM